MELNFRPMFWVCWKSKEGQLLGHHILALTIRAVEAGAERDKYSRVGQGQLQASYRLQVTLSFSRENKEVNWHTK